MRGGRGSTEMVDVTRLESRFQTWLHTFAKGHGEHEDLRREAFEAGWNAKPPETAASGPLQSSRVLSSQPTVSDQHEPTPSQRDAIDAARYRWLRADNAYAPEEAMVRGGDGLDKLCDEGISESR